MKPTETIYRLAISSKDYRDCHNLIQKEDKEMDGPLQFPTVFAKRNDEVIGVFGSVPDKNYVIAGPLVVKGGRNPVVAMRLMEAYDIVMNLNGIKLYYFTVDAARTDTLSRERLEALGMKYWGENGGLAWFKKELGNGRQDKHSSASTI